MVKLYDLLDNTNYLKEQDKINKTILYKDKVEVRQYLSLKEKFDFIMEALLKSSEDNGYVSRTKATIAFRLLIMKYYTDIDFSNFVDNDNLSDEDLYDICYINGLMGDIFKLIPKNEYEELLEMLLNTVDEINEANKSLVNAIDTINKIMVKGIERMNEQAQALDTEQVDKVIDLAETLGFKG